MVESQTLLGSILNSSSRVFTSFFAFSVDFSDSVLHACVRSPRRGVATLTRTEDHDGCCDLAVSVKAARSSAA